MPSLVFCLILELYIISLAALLESLNEFAPRIYSVSIFSSGEEQSLKSMPPQLHLLIKAYFSCTMPGQLKRQPVDIENSWLNSVLSNDKHNEVSFVVDFYPAAAKYQSDIKGKLPIN